MYHLVSTALRGRDPGTEGCIAQLAAWERQYCSGQGLLERLSAGRILRPT
jgi:hypothetical protein